MSLSCFKAYDIRGIIGDEINSELVYKVGIALGNYLQAKSFVLGSDVRLTSEGFKLDLARGLQDAGVDVIDIGNTGTEEIYFATSFLQTDGGVEITASHNPINFNGLKIVKKNSVAMGYDDGLKDIEYLIETNDLKLSEVKGNYKKIDLHQDYVNKLISFINLKSFTNPMKLVINSGNGAAGRTIDSIERIFEQYNLPVEIIKVHNEPDGNFPNGIPNPLLIENRDDTIRAIKEHKADLGIAFDGDFDRCFFFDHNGRFIDGYYIVGLLAKSFLENGSEAIVYEPRLIWNTEDIISKYNGKAILTKAGHSFIKKQLRDNNAIYGGEMSAHHYFRDYYYCDSGMLTWLVVVNLLQKLNVKISDLVEEMFNNYPISGEISFTVKYASALFTRVKEYYSKENPVITEIDGLSLEFTNWRFNLRSSNTEPYVRLNLETRGDLDLLNKKVVELTELIDDFNDSYDLYD